MTPPKDTPALEARDLTLAWGDGRVVAEHLSLSVGAGECVALVGRSGTGKTTLLHTLAGLARPRSGEVLVHGEDVTGEPGHVSYMLQKDLLLPSKTVLDNVCLPLVLKGMSREEARKVAEPLLERFGLSGAGERWPSEHSGGMRQRAAFLRTYLMGSDVLLLDEPFSALDALTRREMRAWFAGIAEELSVSALVITHDVDEARAMASRILVLAGNPSRGIPSALVGELAPDADEEEIIALLG